MNVIVPVQLFIYVIFLQYINVDRLSKASLPAHAYSMNKQHTRRRFPVKPTNYSDNPLSDKAL